MGKPDWEEWAREHRAEKEQRKKRKYRINQFRKAVRLKKVDKARADKLFSDLQPEINLVGLIELAAALQQIAHEYYGPELEEMEKNARTE